MKKILSLAVILPLLSATAFAQEISISVTDIADEAVSSADNCNIVMQVENMTAEPTNMTIMLTPTFKQGTLSGMFYEAGNSFGNQDNIQFDDIQPGSSMSGNDGLLGVVCADLASLIVEPSCNGAACDTNVVLSPASILAIATEAGTATIGGLPDTSPKGEMHGQWDISSAGKSLFTLNITQQLDDSAVGIFTSHPAICAIGNLPEDCLQGGIVDAEIRYISLSDNRVVVIVETSDSDTGRFNLIWDFAAGTGKLGNINSANLAIFVATRSN